MFILKTKNMKKLLLTFFEGTKYPGWENIATKLIETGECIVAGNKCIWIGGIGNFINTSPAIGPDDCLLYRFNVEHFKTSAWYKEVRDSYLINLSKNISLLTKEINTIYEEIQEIEA